jgi:hypothetical protein
MTQYAITPFAQYDSEDLEPLAPEDPAAHECHSEDLQRAGVMVTAFALESPATSTLLRRLTRGDFGARCTYRRSGGSDERGMNEHTNHHCG